MAIWDFEKYSNNIAVMDDGGNCFSYNDLEEHCNDLAAAIGKRSLVFNMSRNTIGSFLGYVSMLQNSIVPVMLKADLDSRLLLQLFDEYKPEYVWLPKEDIKKDIWKSYEVIYTDMDYSLIKTSDENPGLSQMLALLLTTSGSTGSQKFVRQSYNNIIENTKSIVAYLQITERERPITVLPMNYTYGLSIINTHLWAGACVLLTDKSLMQAEFWDFAKNNKMTSISGVPYTYEMLKKLRFTKIDLPELKTLTQAGGKLSVGLQKEYAEYAKDTGRNFVIMYGQCEATARMSYLPADKVLEKEGSIGIAIPGGRFELIDVDGDVIRESDKTGELVYYGKNVTLGYATVREDLEKDDERNGRLETGDMAKCDSDGYYYIVGRKKRFLKIFGNRVNLDDIEQLLKVDFPDMDFACGGRDDLLYIYCTDNDVLPAMKKSISEKTNLNPSAFKTVRVDTIPRNDSGKIQYKELPL